MRIYCTSFLAWSGIAFEAGFRGAGNTSKLSGGPDVLNCGSLFPHFPRLGTYATAWLTVFRQVVGYAQIFSAAATPTANPKTMTVPLSLVSKRAGIARSGCSSFIRPPD